MMPSPRVNGFTLIEMVMTIVLLGIIAGMLVPVITQATNAYVDTSARSELMARGRLALERLAKEIRRVVPNTVQEINGGTGIEFVTSKVGGRYMSRKDNFSPASYTNASRFRKNASLTNLYVLGITYNDFVNTDRLVIYNESPATLNNRSVLLTGVADQDPDSSGINHVQRLTFGNKAWDVEPEMQHYQVADFCHEVGQSGTTLYWQRGTDFDCLNNAPPASWNATDPILVSADALTTTFEYLPTSLTSNGILKVTLELTEQGESITISQEMHVRNTP